MNRREVIALLGSTALWPALVHAQQSGGLPVIGFLHSGAPEPNARRVAGFLKGLAEGGFVDGKNVTIDFRWALGQDDKLKEMAADLVRRRVSVIATLSSTVAAVAAKAATSTIPLYFLIAEPPVELGLVTSMNRPGGNATGIVTLAAELAAKRLSLLREFVPQPFSMAALVKTDNPSAKVVTESLQSTARVLGVKLDMFEAATEREIEEVFAAIKTGVPLFVATDPFFFSRRAQFVALAAKHQVPAIYDSREFAEAGGLFSYGPNHVRLWQQAGTYVARILKGQKPGEIPVEQAATFELVINLKTAKLLALSISQTRLALADEVIR